MLIFWALVTSNVVGQDDQTEVDANPLGHYTNYSGVVGSGARAFGMGGAFIAVADDATAASWNPGGLGQLEGVEFSFVTRYQATHYQQAAMMDGESFYQGAYISRSTGYNIDFASLTVPFRIGKLKLVPQISYQRAINYHSNGIGKNVSTWSITTLADGTLYKIRGFLNKEMISMKGLDQLSFSLGSRIGRLLSFGLTVNYWFNGLSNSLKKAGTFEILLDKELQTVKLEQNYTAQAQFDVKGININAGVLLTVSEALRFGLVYKSALNADIDYGYTEKLHQAFFIPNQGYTDIYDVTFVDVIETGRIHWPWSLGLGLAYNPFEALTLSGDFTFCRWSEAKVSHFINFEWQNENDPQYVDVSFPTMGNQQTDSWQARLGAEYVVLGKNILVPLRFGAFIDRQFFLDVNTDNVSFFGLTTGFGIKTGILALDLAVVYQSGTYIDNVNRVAPLNFSDLRVYLSTIISL